MRRGRSAPLREVERIGGVWRHEWRERPPSADLQWGPWFQTDTNTLLGFPNLATNGNTTCVVPAGYAADKVDNPCAWTHYWSVHTGGANWLLADGSVRLIRYGSATVLSAMATIAGDEVVGDF